MEEQKFGIENLKKIVAFGCDLTKQINQSLEDGWQWTDAFSFVDEIATIPGVVKSIPAVKQELDAAREEQKLYTSGQFMDTLREGRATSAEKSGDAPRAQRIRSTKQTQGMGESGRDEKGRKRFSKGGYVKYGK